jgi:hypothetical protein
MAMRRVTIVLVALLACACGGGAPAPEGWLQADAGGLHFAYPGDWRLQPEGERAFPEATVELVGPEAGQPLGPLLAAFAYEGAMQDVDLRADMVSNRLRAELGAVLVNDQDLAVPGTAAGRVLEFTFDARASQDGARVPSRQFEVMLSGEDGSTWDLILGGPVATLRQADVEAILRSLRVG